MCVFCDSMFIMYKLWFQLFLVFSPWLTVLFCLNCLHVYLYYSFDGFISLDLIFWRILTWMWLFHGDDKVKLSLLLFDIIIFVQVDVFICPHILRKERECWEEGEKNCHTEIHLRFGKGMRMCYGLEFTMFAEKFVTWILKSLSKNWQQKGKLEQRTSLDGAAICIL